MGDLEKAKAAARQFGGEAELNELPSWSRDDREDIARHYGAETWKDIPVEDQCVLLAEYRYGEKAERAKSFAERVVLETTRDWTPADWEGETNQELIGAARKMLDESPELYFDLFNAKIAFERFMGWAL